MADVGRGGWYVDGRTVCAPTQEKYTTFRTEKQEGKVSCMSKLNEAIVAIEKQQPKERTPVWMVGEQLKDMLRNEPELAELVREDLENKGMALAECEKKIKAFADKHKSGDFSCVIPSEAERIIREFYGLPERGTKPGQKAPSGKVLDLADFL